MGRGKPLIISKGEIKPLRKNIYADLHNHTTASDGDLTPEELVQRMKSLGVSVVGVTDHDTDKGLRQAIAEGRRIGVKVLPGVEISVRFKEDFFTGTVHLLCYFQPQMLDNSLFSESLHNTLGKGRGDHLVRARADEINKFFGHKGKTPILKRELTFEEVASYSPTVTRRHFALALTERHGIENPDIVNKIIGNSSPAYLPSGVDIESVKEFVNTIENFCSSKEKNCFKNGNQLKKQTPFMLVLAHPAAGSFPGEGHYKEVLPPIEIVERLFPRCLDAGISGIEINYPGHIKEHRDILRQWALKYNLAITGGSDCHDAVIRPPGVEGITKEEFEKYFYRILL